VLGGEVRDLGFAWVRAACQHAAPDNA